MRAVLALSVMGLVACGDMNVSVGELGRVSYALHTDYITTEVTLAGSTLVAGHPLTIETGLTDAGDRKAGKAAEDIRHRFSEPTADVATDETDDSIPNLTITADGDVDGDLQSMLDGDVFDYLPLTFREPDALGALTYTRGALDEDMEGRDGRTFTVEEGGSAALLPFPRRDGERLVGDIRPELTMEPEGLAVLDYDTFEVYEQNVYGGTEPYTIVFIEPGELTVTLTDPVWGVSVERVFTVTPYGG